MKKSIHNPGASGPVKLTERQLKLAAEYLATSNVCTLDRFRGQYKDISSLLRCVRGAVDDFILAWWWSGCPQHWRQLS